jgi:hypothetical protein
MASDFDPYYRWLGIPPEEQPADHYRLLGVRQFETHADVISNASDQRMAHLRTFASGQRGMESQRLLNEVAAATRTLLDPAKRRQYDEQLRARLAKAQPYPVPQATFDAAPLPPVPFVNVRRPVRRKSSSSLLWCMIGLAAVVLAVPISLAVYLSDRPEPVLTTTAPTPSPAPSAKAASEPPVAPVATATKAADTAAAKRTAWFYPVGPDGKSRGVIRRLGAKQWRQNATDNVFHFTELEQTADYIALRENSRDVTIRLYADRLEFSAEGGPWTPAQKGRWVEQGELADLLKAPAESVAATTPTANEPVPNPPTTTGEAPASSVNVTKYVFDGSGVARVNSGSSLLNVEQPFTIQCWYRRTDNLQGPVGILRCGDLNVVLGSGLRDGLQATWCELNAGKWKSAFYRAAHDHQWHHLAVASDGTQVRVYHDGKPYHAATYEELAVGELNPIEFGSASSQDGQQWLRGELHSIRVSNADEFEPGEPFRPSSPAETSLPDEVTLELRNGVVAARPSAPRTSLSDLATSDAATEGGEAAAERSAKPAAAELKTARDKMDDVYGSQIKRATKVDDKAKLAAELLRVAKSDRDSATAWVLLEESQRLAGIASDVSLCLEVLEERQRRFDVPPAQELLSAVKELAPRSLPPPEREALVRAALAGVQAAFDNDDLPAADALAAAATAAANRGRDLELKKVTRQTREHLETVKTAWEAKEAAQAKLEQSPTDRAANLTVGKYIAFYQSDYNAAAPYLAQGADDLLAAAAKAELAATAADEQSDFGARDTARAAAAEAWYTALSSLKGFEKLSLQRELLTRSEALTQRLTGLPKEQVEKRIAELKPIVVEAQKNAPALSKGPQYSPGLVARLLTGPARNPVPTPFVEIVGAEQELYQVDAFELLRAYPLRSPRFALTGVLVLRKETKVSLTFADCTCMLAGRALVADGRIPYSDTITMSKGTYPIAIVSLSASPRFNVSDAETSQSLLFHTDRQLQMELEKMVPLPNGSLAKSQRITPVFNE